MQYLGEAAFLGCSELHEVNLAGVQTVSNVDSGDVEAKDGIFQNCQLLERLAFPVLSSDIPSDMFSGCSGLKVISLPLLKAGCIPQGTFSTCSALKFLNISQQVPLDPCMKTYRTAIGVVNSDCIVICANG